MKITRIQLAHPVSRPGKRDDNYHALPPPGGGDEWALEWLESQGVVRAEHDSGTLLVPMTNVKAIEV